MNWDDLRYFLAAYRHRSLAAAGRELGCDYTTVGRRVAALETALSASLFLRASDGLVPTPAADELLPWPRTWSAPRRRSRCDATRPSSA
jgi:DNA-binding transcriptional LysR family regulator